MPGTPRVAITLTQCWHSVPGGTASSILRLVRAVDAVGRVGLVGVGPMGDIRRPSSMRPDRHPPRPWMPSIPVRRLGLPLPLLYDSWTRWGRPSIEAATGPVDIVHVTVPMRVPLGAAPVVATVHDLFPLTHPAQSTARGSRLMSTGLEWIREHAARVMVPSETVERTCVEHGFDPDRLRVVPWGVTPVSVDDDTVAEVRRRHGLRGPYVLFVGTQEPRKNLETLLRAMTTLGRPDVTLALAGPAGWGDALDTSLASVPYPVARLGFVADADLAALERGAEVFCFPSLAEGFGLPVLEAMSAGAAVVTSSGTATGEVAGDAALLVDPTDHTALAEALASVLDSPETAARLRTAGVARAAAFTWERAATRTLAVYDEVLR